LCHDIEPVDGKEVGLPEIEKAMPISICELHLLLNGKSGRDAAAIEKNKS
jgi:hypothetical protein